MTRLKPWYKVITPLPRIANELGMIMSIDTRYLVQ